MSDVDKMIAEACKQTGPLVGYPDVIEVLLCVGLPLETLAALRSGAWKAVPTQPTEKMLDALWDGQCRDEELLDAWSATLAAAPAKPGDDT